MRVEVVLGWPRRFESRHLEVPPGTTAATAAAASGLDLSDVVGYAVFGVRIDPETCLREGERLELLRPLVVDPKESRRRRAAARKPLPRPPE